MPSYGTVKWKGYRVRVFAEERDLLRVLPIVPYFWESDINLDMVADPPKDIQRTEQLSLSYRWELHDLDGKVARSGQGSYEFAAWHLPNMRKHRAIEIGFLKPHQCYRLKIILTDRYGTTSQPMQIATFTTKDKDEVYTQVMISLITIAMGIIIGFLARGCS